MFLCSGRGIEDLEAKKARRAKKGSPEREGQPDPWYWIQFSVFRRAHGGLLILNEISVNSRVEQERKASLDLRYVPLSS